MIVIILSGRGGELDRTELPSDIGPDDGSQITQAVVEFIMGSILLPGDTITVAEEEAP